MATDKIETPSPAATAPEDQPLSRPRSDRRVIRDRGVVEAHVTTAQPLTADRIISIEHSLTQASGREVTMTTTVDPEILGGLIARLGTTVYDGSIARHLERMRETLLAR